MLVRRLVATSVAAVTALALAAGPVAGATVPSPAPPSAADIAREQQRAAALRAQAHDQQVALNGAQDRLASLGAAASAALEAFSIARQVAALAEAEAAAAAARATDAERRAAVADAELQRYAAQSYLTGDASAFLRNLSLMLSTRGSDSLDYGLTLLQAVGEQQTFVLQMLEDARQEAQAARSEAAEASARKAASKQAMAAAKVEADALVAAQQRYVEQTAAQLAATQAAATGAAKRAALLAEQRRKALLAALGTCRPTPMRAYANGRLLRSALCPLWAAPGQALRPEAAAAFNRLSAAYVGVFGRPICVTDSYRSYAAQLTVFDEKPSLAAFPGTSEHGWGRAVDLCGGVQNASSVPHRWLQVNAPRFGWFHPSWAEPSGSRPEAWHWEYGG